MGVIEALQACRTQVRFGTNDHNEERRLQGHEFTVRIGVTVNLERMHKKILDQQVEFEIII